MTIMKKPVCMICRNDASFGGASVIGALHTKEGIPNQDSFLIKKKFWRKNCIVNVVADGIGSHKHSDIGSKAIVNAVYRNASLLNKESNLNKFIERVKKDYLRNLNGFSPEECGTTCIFAIVFSNKICIGQIGDGLCCYDIDGNFDVLNERDSDFLNETKSVAEVITSDEWNIKVIPYSQSVRVLLATDGISDDLIPEARSVFLGRLSKAFMGLDNEKICNAISEVINGWDRPHSFDDKTMVVCVREMQDENKR